MAQATLFNPRNPKDKKIVTVNSPEASQLLSQGYEIFREPAPQATAPPPIAQNLPPPQGNPFDPAYRQATRRAFGVEDLESKRQKGTEEFQNFATGQAQFADMLRQALLKRDTAAESLEAEQRRTREQLRSAPSEYRQELIEGGVTDPFARKKLISQREGTLQSAIDAITGQIERQAGTREQALERGLAGYQTGVQRQQFGLEDIAQQLAQKESDISDYLQSVAGEQEFQRKSDLERSLQSIRSAPKPSDKITQTDKTDYNESLSGLRDVIVTTGDPNRNLRQITREEAIQIMAENYTWKNPNDIAKDIYKLYPDPEETSGGLQSPFGGAYSPIQNFG